MQYKPTRSLCATVAIAATLALGSTTYAQEAAPVVAVPAAPVPVAAPTISVPPVTVQPTAPQPVAAETATRATPEPAARQAPTPRARAERAAPAERPAPRQAAPAAATSTPVGPAAVAPAAAPATAPVAQAPLAAAAPAPVAEPARTPVQADDGLTGEEMGFLALLAAIGLGGIAFLMTRKRRRASLDDAEMVEAVEYAADPVAEPAPMLKAPVTLATSTVRAQPTYETPVMRHEPVYAATDHPGMPDMAEPAQAPSVVSTVAPRSTAPAESAMPSGPVPHGEARSELLDRMTSAAPDEANPFTSKKARRRRARLILQRMEADQGSGEAKPFDWRTYEPSSTQRQREPELA